MKSYGMTALCLCTVIGAGFATGRELMTYFVDFGIYGLIGIAVVSALFTLAIYIALESDCRSIGELTRSRLPRPLAFIAEKTVFVFLIVLYSAMLAAAGEVFSLIFGIDKSIGTVLMAFLCLTVIVIGASALTELSKILLIPMALIIFVIGGTAAGKNIAFPPRSVFTLKAALSPVIYLSYNMITAAALIVTLPKTKNSKSVALQTGLFIFILMTVLSLPLYTHYSSVCNEPLPLMAILEDGKIKYMYILFLLFAIFTTAVSCGYSAAGFIKERTGGTAASCIITGLAYALSLIGFSDIVDKVYFIFGIAGMTILLALIQKHRFSG